MTRDEIYERYSTAKNKAQQIEILAELNDCDIDDMVVLLADYITPVEDNVNYNNVFASLTQKLDALEKEIREREEQFKKITIAMEVIAGFGGGDGISSKGE